MTIPGTATVAMGGDAVFGGFQLGATHESGNEIAVGDFDGDGLSDLVAGTGAILWFLRGNEDTTMQDPEEVSLPFGMFDVRAGDVDGDGAVGLDDLLMILSEWGPVA